MIVLSFSKTSSKACLSTSFLSINLIPKSLSISFSRSSNCLSESSLFKTLFCFSISSFKDFVACSFVFNTRSLSKLILRLLYSISSISLSFSLVILSFFAITNQYYPSSVYSTVPLSFAYKPHKHPIYILNHHLY